MSHERDQAKLQRHIREAEERATAGGHALGPWQPASQMGGAPGDMWGDLSGEETAVSS
jgi:hypothetical protein